MQFKNFNQQPEVNIGIHRNILRKLRTTGHSLEINPENGRILKDREAQKLWSREYEKGWEMKL